MREMLFFEWKKIFNRRFNLIAMAVGYFLILVCTINYITQNNFWDAESEQYVYGVSAYEIGRVRNEEKTDYLTEEYLTELTKEIQARNIPLGSDEGYTEVIRPMGIDLLWVLGNAYVDVGETVDWGKLSEIPTEGGIHFYERRLQKISEYLNMDFSYGNYSEAEKEFWLNKAKEVQTPFRWGNTENMDTVWITIMIDFYLLFVISICIAPVFASEYESGAAALLLTTKKGKTKLITAKILAAVLFSLCYMGAGIGMGVVIEGLMIGFYGNDLPIQLWGTSIPYNWSVGETCVISFLLMLLITLSIALLTLAWSSRLKSGIIVLVLDFTLIIGPAFLPMSKSSGLWNHINYLFPVRIMNMENVLKAFNSYQFGDVVLSYIGMIVLVYVLVATVSLLMIKGGFAKHQIK